MAIKKLYLVLLGGTCFIMPSRMHMQEIVSIIGFSAWYMLYAFYILKIQLSLFKGEK